MTSPVLANLFMHYAFDTWLVRKWPGITFERYADDAVVHCVSERQARDVLAALMDRMEEVGLRLHPDKTQIVYCGTVSADALRGDGVHLPRVHVSRTREPEQARTAVHVVRAGDQQGSSEEDQCGSPQLAAPHPV
ncbi:reverse transcriptase domain-containing protein [Streptomyces sp. NPDC054841]